MIEDSPVKGRKNDNKKSKKKRIISDDEDEGGDDSSVSINDIKKQANKRAKTLSKSMEGGEEPKPKPQSSKKSPAPVQKNTLLNYFQRTKSSSSLDKSLEEDKKKTPPPQKAEISDEFMTTTIIKDDVIVKKSKESERSKDSKNKLPVKTSKEEPATKEELKTTTKPKEEDKKLKNYKENKVDKNSQKEEKDDKFGKPAHKEEKSKVKEEKVEKSKTKEETKTSIKNVEKNKRKHQSESPESPLKKSSKDKKKRVLSDSEDEVFQTTVLSDSPVKTRTTPKKKEPVKEVKKATPKKPSVKSEPRIEEPKRISELWVDKYKPVNPKGVIGMHGDRSPLNKLLKWLKDWHLNLDQKPAFNKFGGNNDGVGLRAALLSGPPGIGKTTSAQLACKELGYDFLEMNASDKRSQKSIKEDVKDLLANTKLTHFFGQRNSSSEPQLTAKHCLIMDEVDGMAGNEDRGGVAELIQLIKTTKVPIICICNDRSHPKIRSLVNYCFDLRFPKPKLENIRGPLKSICFKEKVDIPTKVIDDLIVSTNYDIRQCIGNLAMLAAGQKNVKSMLNQGEKPIKDVKLGPFDAIRKVFSTGQEYAMMSFADKSDLFFSDYSIMPLFVYENYCQINLGTKETSVAKQLKRMSRSIDAISRGDMIERELRSNQNYSLLPLQAALSTVMPGSYMRSTGGLGMPQFPQYMGKISTTNKNIRLLDELVSHMNLSISGTRTSFALDYLESMKNSLAQPLQTRGSDAVPDILDIMENYSMTRENMNSLFELSLWNGENDPLKNVDPKVKRALTAAYNKKDFALPYAGDSDIKKLEKRGKGSKAKGKASAFSVPDATNSDEEFIDDGEEDVAEDFY